MSKQYIDLRELLNNIQKNFSDEVGFKVKNKGKIEEIKYSKYVEEAKALGEYLLNLDISNGRVCLFLLP